MNKNITTVACINGGLGIGRVARDDYAAVDGVESIAVGFRERVLRRKGGHSDIRVFVDHSRTDLMNINFARVAVIARLPCLSGDAFLDVGLPRRYDVIGHRLDPLRAIDLERYLSTHHPWRKNEIGIADGMIRVQMGRKRYGQVRG